MFSESGTGPASAEVASAETSANASSSEATSEATAAHEYASSAGLVDASSPVSRVAATAAYEDVIHKIVSRRGLQQVCAAALELVTPARRTSRFAPRVVECRPGQYGQNQDYEDYDAGASVALLHRDLPVFENLRDGRHSGDHADVVVAA